MLVHKNTIGTVTNNTKTRLLPQDKISKTLEIKMAHGTFIALITKPEKHKIRITEIHMSIHIQYAENGLERKPYWLIAIIK